MVAATLVLLSLFLVIFPPSAGTRWHSGQLVRGEHAPSRVHEDAEVMDQATVRLEQSVNFVHEYLVNMLSAATKFDSEMDIRKKAALLRVVQTRLQELRLGRKEIKKDLEKHRKTVKKLSKRAEKLKEELPLWYEGVAQKLQRAEQAIARTKHWLDSEEKLVASEEERLAQNVAKLRKLVIPPPLTSDSYQARPGASSTR